MKKGLIICMLFASVRCANAQVPAPTGTVDVSVFPNSHLLDIPSQFYGVNCHPGPAYIHFKSPEVIKALNLDMIRIMANKRTWWDAGVRYDEYLSPVQGVWNWTKLEELIDATKTAGAEPYISLGFGAPPWLNGGGGVDFNLPSHTQIPTYAGHMADIVDHLNNTKNYDIEWFSIENEPENVGYPIGDYAYLATNATPLIKATDNSVQVSGPVTGNSYWPQPDGPDLSFGQSAQALYDMGVRFDAIDWHVYSASLDVISNTIVTLKSVWGESTPLILSEMNLDWRYDGSGGEESAATNTSWASVTWLSQLYDLLQQDGVDKAFYFSLGNDTFGLMDYHQTEVRPNYYTIWLMTNLMGRERVATSSSHPLIGTIATKDKQALFLYNLADGAVDVKISFPDTSSSLDQYFTYTEAWYEQNNVITNDSIGLPTLQSCTNASQITIPAHSIAVVTYKTPGVLAYEGFDYSGTGISGQNGGSGWGSAWVDSDADLDLSNDDTSLDSAAFPFAPAGDRVLDSGGGEANRNLGTPMVMNAEGNIMYFSMLIRKDSIASSSSEWVEMSLANGTSKRFKMGIGSNDKFYVIVGDDTNRGESIETSLAGTTYFLVAKLVSGVSSQNAYLKVYAPGDTVAAADPDSWTATSTGFTSYTLDRLDLNFGGNVSDGSVDELRMGASWMDVAVSPTKGTLLIIQ